jgi:hypothetical protein
MPLLMESVRRCANNRQFFVECLNQGSVYGIICLLISFCDKATAEANRKNSYQSFICKTRYSLIDIERQTVYYIY